MVLGDMTPDLTRAAPLIAKGYGDRRLAAALGVTRHKARGLIGEAQRGARGALVEIEPRTASEYAERIASCWRKSVEAIFEVGRLLIRAKEQLAHGEFEAMVESRLPFGASTGQRLMIIARDARLSNPAHVQLLPPSWGTLYELTKLNDRQFEQGVKSGVIRPDMERKAVVNGARSVMGSRQEPDDSLDWFATPPWATRALVELVLPQADIFWEREPGLGKIWEPACGDGIMSEVLAEYSGRVFGSDIHDYCGNNIRDFLTVNAIPGEFDWIITNPPFRGDGIVPVVQADRALEFTHRALDLAGVGVAIFVRSQWAVEGIERYETLFRDRPPTLFAPFVERVNLCKGAWNPDGKTATAYCWLVWLKLEHGNGALQAPRPPYWIPPGCRVALHRPDDIARFAAWSLEEAHDPVTGEIP
jgi:hypothetical protein